MLDIFHGSPEFIPTSHDVYLWKAVGVTVLDHPPPSPVQVTPGGWSESSFKLLPLVSTYPLNFTG